MENNKNSSFSPDIDKSNFINEESSYEILNRLLDDIKNNMMEIENFFSKDN